jgi:hypothetical protein
MALDQPALLEVLEALKAADVGDRVRDAAATIYQALVEAELTAVIGAAGYERTAERSNYRNGSRPPVLATPAGDLELRIPKLRVGSFFPSLLERRRRIDQALFAVVMEGLPARGVHAQGRRPRPGARRRHRHLQDRGEPDLRRARHRGGRLPRPQPRLIDAHREAKGQIAPVIPRRRAGPLRPVGTDVERLRRLSARTRS